MTKSRKTAICALAVFIALALASATALAGEKVTITKFTATEEQLGIEDSGTVTFPGGNIHVRGEVSIVGWSSLEPRLDKFTFRVDVNANFNAESNGPMWGTFESIDNATEGKWVGSWHGEFTDESIGAFMHTGVGFGVGAFEGMQMKYACTYVGNTAVGVCEGRILETGKR